MTPTNSSDQKEIISLIQKAFGGCEYPGDDHLVERRPSGGIDPESMEVQNAFCGKHWRDITPRLLFDHRQCIVLFTPEAWRFYLPGYMICSIQHYDEVDTVPHEVFQTLTPSFHRKREWFDVQVSGLTPAERAAVRRFLEFMEKHHGQDYHVRGPGNALLEYWARGTVSN